MKQYTVEVTESVAKRMTISAESGLEAEKKAMEHHEKWKIMQFIVDLPETVGRTVSVSVKEVNDNAGVLSGN